MKNSIVARLTIAVVTFAAIIVSVDRAHGQARQLDMIRDAVLEIRKQLDDPVVNEKQVRAVDLRLLPSRELKQDIVELDATQATEAVKKLKPVEYSYKKDPQEKHVGFIAEDVPELVATNSRKGLASMDVVAVLTKVVQQQQQTMEKQEQTIELLQKRLEQIEKKMAK